MSSSALPPGPPEIPQFLWDAIIGAVSALAGYLARYFQRKK